MAKKNQIAFLGPIGTYSDEAAHLFASHLGIAEPELLECPSFNEVFDAVDRGRCEYGVVPVENSLEGSVTSTMDNFAFSSPATILGQTVLSIHHCLLLHPDAELSDVTTVASHPAGARAVPPLPCQPPAQRQDAHHLVHGRVRPTRRLRHTRGGHCERLRREGARREGGRARCRRPLRQPDRLRAHRPPGTPAGARGRALQDPRSRSS